VIKTMTKCNTCGTEEITSLLEAQQYIIDNDYSTMSEVKLNQINKRITELKEGDTQMNVTNKDKNYLIEYSNCAHSTHRRQAVIDTDNCIYIVCLLCGGILLKESEINRRKR